MGNIKSHIKHKQPSIKKIPEFDQIESDQERNEKLMDFYLSTSIDAIDRSHIYHFLRACIFQSSFSSPVEDKLIQGCKVLDIG
jgi:hypothetical protein